MISLHRPSGQLLVLNPDLIETVERCDQATAIVLTTGNVLEVVETPDAVRAAVLAYRRAIVAGP